MAIRGALLAVLWAVAATGSDLAVRVYDYAKVPRKTLLEAIDQAQGIFRKAGIETAWVECPLEREAAGNYASCKLPIGPADTSVRIVPRSMEGYPVPEWAFGFALASADGRPAANAYAFFDRVMETAREGNLTPCVVLGHVLAHEVGHLILGAGEHSARGLMRRRWENRELMQAERGELVFTRAQARRLRDRIGERGK